MMKPAEDQSLLASAATGMCGPLGERTLPERAEMAACRKLSETIRQGLVDYDLGKREGKLAQILVLESYDRNLLVGRCDFEGWSLRCLPGEADRKGRPGKCRELMGELVRCGIVAWNAVENSYELQPFPGHWSRCRGKGEVNLDLPLRAERPLSEAQCEVGREQVLLDWGSVKAAVNDADAWAKFAQHVDGDGERAEFAQAQGGAAIVNPNSERDSVSVLPGLSGGGKVSGRGPPGEGVRAELSRAPSSPAIASEAPKAELSSCTKAKLSYRAEDALRWLEEQDARGTLRTVYGADYLAMCEEHAEFVLTKLRWGYEEHLKHTRSVTRNSEYRPADPVGWMGKRAASLGMMRWRGRLAARPQGDNK